MLVVTSSKYSPASADFVRALEGELARLPRYTLVAQERTKDYFSVSLDFDGIDEEVTVVSVALGFHERSSDADYFLHHWAGYFFNTEYQERAKLLVPALDEEIARRIAQGWLETEPNKLLLSPNPDVIKTVAKRLAAAFWSFFHDETFDEALATTKAEFDEKDDQVWIAFADHLTWHLLKGIGEKQPNLKEARPVSYLCTGGCQTARRGIRTL